MSFRVEFSRGVGEDDGSGAGMMAGSGGTGGDKRIDRMDRLGDLTQFPAAVNAGATLNVMVTMVATWWLAPRFGQVYAPVVWTMVVLLLNLTPVFLLRVIGVAGWNRRPMPSLREMDFLRDQHRFSDWVYLAASAHMAFWILISWSVFTVWHTGAALAGMLGVAFVITFGPVLVRAGLGRR